MLLLLSEVNNTAILLMALHNAINGKNRWSLYMAMLLSLPLAIDNRLKRLVVMAWHHQGDLASRKTKPLDGTVSLLASISLASASAACLVKCCCVAAYVEWAVAWALRRGASALFVHQVHFRAYRSLLPIAQSSIRVDCCEKFYSSTNQAFVLWRLGACQEWWRLLAQSTCSTWWSADTMFYHRFCDKQPWLPHGATLSTLLLTMTIEKSMTDLFFVMVVAETQAS